MGCRAPRGALSWAGPGKAGRKFSDGSPVTATAVKDALQRTNSALTAAQTELGTMSFVVQDELNLHLLYLL